MIPPDPRPDPDQQFDVNFGLWSQKRNGKVVRGARGVIREIRSIDFVVDFNCHVGSTSAHEVEIPKREFTNPSELEIGSVVEVSLEAFAKGLPRNNHDVKKNLSLLETYVENCMTPYYPAKGGLP